MNWGRLKVVLIVLGGLFILAQFLQPQRTNPPIDQSKTLQERMEVPSQVQPIMDRACSNCHSNLTNWPWYSRVAPISWFVVDDVNQGRRHLNFSDWAAQESPAEGLKHLHQACDEIREERMPPFTYRLMHPEARVSEGEAQIFCSWTDSLPNPPGNPAHSSD